MAEARVALLSRRQDLSEAVRVALSFAGLGFSPVPDAEALDDELSGHDPVRAVLVDLASCADPAAVAERVRSVPVGADVAVFFLGSGQGPITSTDGALAAGGDAYFALPAEAARVLARLATYLDLVLPRIPASLELGPAAEDEGGAPDAADDGGEGAEADDGGFPSLVGLAPPLAEEPPRGFDVADDETEAPEITAEMDAGTLSRLHREAAAHGDDDDAEHERAERDEEAEDDDAASDIARRVQRLRSRLAEGRRELIPEGPPGSDGGWSLSEPAGLSAPEGAADDDEGPRPADAQAFDALTERITDDDLRHALASVAETRALDEYPPLEAMPALADDEDRRQDAPDDGPDDALDHDHDHDHAAADDDARAGADEEPSTGWDPPPLDPEDDDETTVTGFLAPPPSFAEEQAAAGSAEVAFADPLADSGGLAATLGDEDEAFDELDAALAPPALHFPDAEVAPLLDELGLVMPPAPADPDAPALPEGAAPDDEDPITGVYPTIGADPDTHVDDPHTFAPAPDAGPALEAPPGFPPEALLQGQLEEARREVEERVRLEAEVRFARELEERVRMAVEEAEQAAAEERARVEEALREQLLAEADARIDTLREELEQALTQARAEADAHERELEVRHQEEQRRLREELAAGHREELESLRAELEGRLQRDADERVASLARELADAERRAREEEERRRSLEEERVQQAEEEERLREELEARLRHEGDERVAEADARAAEAQARALEAETRAAETEARLLEAQAQAQEQAQEQAERASEAAAQAEEASARAAGAEARALEAEARAAEALQRSSDGEQRAAEAEQRAAAAERRALEAEQRAAEAESRTAAAEARAEEAEKRSADAAERSAEAAERSAEAEQRSAEAEARADAAEKRSAEAEARAEEAEKRSAEAAERSTEAEERSAAAEARADEAEKRSAEAEQRAAEAAQRLAAAEARALAAEDRAAESEARAAAAEARAQAAEAHAADAARQATEDIAKAAEAAREEAEERLLSEAEVLAFEAADAARRETEERVRAEAEAERRELLERLEAAEEAAREAEQRTIRVVEEERAAREQAEQALQALEEQLERHRRRWGFRPGAALVGVDGDAEHASVHEGGASALGVGRISWWGAEQHGAPLGAVTFAPGGDLGVEPPPPPDRWIALEPGEGAFGDGELPSLLWSAHVLEVTGALVLEDKAGLTRTLFLERGEPVGFASDLSRDRPEEALLRAGFITAAKHTELRAGPLRSARRACAHLVDEGALKPQELFTAVRGVLIEQVLSLLEIPGGTFRYAREVAHAADRVRLQHGFDALLAEGVRRKYDLPRLWRVLGGAQTLVGKDDRAPRLPPLTPAERAALALLDGQRSLEDAVLDGALPAEDVLRAALIGVACGAARVLARGVPGAPAEQRHDQERALAIDKARIEDRLHVARHGDYFAFLGIAPESTSFEVRRAAEHVRRQFDPRRYSDPAFQALKDALDEIRQVADEAEAVLADDALRAGYVRNRRGVS